jgi:LysM repeat protein
MAKASLGRHEKSINNRVADPNNAIELIILITNIISMTKYTVQSGDTLGKIAAKMLGKAAR